MNKIDLSIIIVSWNVRELLRECLLSIQNSKQDLSYEIIVIDNASTDNTREMLEQDFPNLDVEYNKVNEGLAKPWNRAAEKSKGEYLLFLNDDTKIFDHVLDKCVTELKSDNNIGVLGCKIKNPDNSIQLSVRRFPTVWNQAVILSKLHNIFPSLIRSYMMTDFDYNKSQNVDQVMGAFFLLPRTVFEKINGFDEEFFIWFEEVDVCRRVYDAGYVVRYFADASIIHYGGASFSQRRPLKLQKMFNKSLKIYFKKHHHKVAWIFISLACFKSLILAWVIDLFRLKK